MMHTAENRVILTFYTTAGAMQTETICRQHGIDGRLIPVPRSLSASCGIAWSSPSECEPELRTALAETEVEVAGWHELVI